MASKYNIGDVIYRTNNPYGDKKASYGWIWDIKEDVYVIKWGHILEYIHWGRHHKIKDIDSRLDIRLVETAEVILFTNFFKEKNKTNEN